MENKDIRWIQRFSNYRKALKRLGSAVALSEERALSDLEEQGLIQAFEFVFDMAWKTLQDYVFEQGYAGERGRPNPIITDAAERGLIDEALWKAMTKSRNLTSHTYDEELADQVAADIIESFYGLFIQLETRLQIEKLNQEKNG